jgi:hypothetical protein
MLHDSLNGGIMKVEFKKPVTFSTIHRAFIGEGVPSIPEDAYRLVVGANTVVYVSPRGEAWECFIGNGASETSETYYWPALAMCPREWARGAGISF